MQAEYIFQIDSIKNTNIRLDKYLAAELPFSRNIIQKWLIKGNIKVNDISQLAKYKIKFGDVITIKESALPEELAFIGQNIPLDIIFEDKYICIINKPAGLVMHPAPGNWHNTLLNALLYHFPQTQILPRAGIVHRLDKMTSGLLITAKDLQTQEILAELIRQKQIKRQYLAIVQGNTLAKGEIEKPIGRHPINKTKMAIVENGKYAKTYYKKLANIITDVNRSKSLVECTLDTGRTHQIRVHMNSINHSLLGDTIYSNDKTSMFANVQRQALHSIRLFLNHPITKKPINFVSKPNDELMQNAILEFENIIPYNLYKYYQENYF